MALIRLKGKRFSTIPHEKAVAIWYVMNGELQGTAKQRAFAATVDTLYSDGNNLNAALV